MWGGEAAEVKGRGGAVGGTEGKGLRQYAVLMQPILTAHGVPGNGDRIMSVIFIQSEYSLYTIKSIAFY